MGRHGGGKARTPMGLGTRLMALSAQGLRYLSRRLQRGPADLRRTAGIENATRGLLIGGVMGASRADGCLVWQGRCIVRQRL